MPTFLRYNEVLDLLQGTGGLRCRQARTVLKEGLLPPHPHQLHGRRLWLKQRVLDYCHSVHQSPHALGKVECSDS